MTYRINKTDGNLLTDIPDGILETDSTSLTLIGKNVTNFGESLNENFVKLLENFASVSQPEKALRGQLWYDTSTGKLNVFDGSSFRSSGGPIISPNTPENPIAGDLWINTYTNQIFFCQDGFNFTLAGPVYEAQQGKSGIEVESILDINNRGKTIAKLYAGSILLGIFSGETFRPLNPIDGFSGTVFSATTTYRKGERVRYFAGIYEAIIDLPTSNILPSDTSYWREVLVQKGFTAAESADFKFNVTATRAESILTATGEAKLADQIVYNDEDGVIVGSLNLQSNNGLTLGGFSNVRHRIEGSTYVIQNDILNNDIDIRVKNTVNSPLPEEQSAIYIDASTNRIGVFNNSPLSTLDITGDVRISGNLSVGGDAMSEVEINATTLQVADNSIELNISNGTNGTDAEAAGGGVILRGDTTKSILYQDNLSGTTKWELSDNVNIPAGKTYKIGDQTVISETSLGAGITTILGVTEIQSPLNYLYVDDIEINGNIIASTVTNGDLVLQTVGTGQISVSGTNVVDLADPVDPQDAATKAYVDSSIYARGLAFTFDVSAIPGLTGDPVADDAIENDFIISTLNTIAPVFPNANPLIDGVASLGAYARIHTTATSVTNGTTSYNPVLGTDYQTVSVDKNGVTESQLVVYDIVAKTIPAAAATVSVTRKNKLFRVVAGGSGLVWDYVSTL